MTKMLDEILKDKTSVAIGGHVRPDGDCVGACMGLYLYMASVYPKIQADVYLEEIPEPFEFLRGTEQIKHTAPKNKRYDLFISLDCGDSERLGFSESLFRTAESTFCVDHHISNQSFADINYIVPDASSTCELLFRLMDQTRITKEVAEALYVGIAHDTGVFLYSCTAPETMEAAATLLRTGIDANAIIDRTYYVKTYIQNQILGRALLESILLLNHKCIASVITKNVMDFYEAKPSDLEGIVSQLRNTEGVEVAIFMYELENQVFKVSLRSNGNVNVSTIAQYFGGGGHERAAGVTMRGTSYDVMNNLLRQIAHQLPKESGKQK
ncbi:MAG: bifunctional oligoribonuclease/PAP phosphatase NrnA [Hespellia sp.]|nr:bifunctional oligoribonuclease/PAP phosphatase NrnA [Hespellia sp.]